MDFQTPVIKSKRGVALLKQTALRAQEVQKKKNPKTPTAPALLRRIDTIFRSRALVKIQRIIVFV